MHDSDFMPVEDHFARLVAGMNPEDFSLYSRAQHVRVETGFAGRQFIVYQMEGRQPKELDRIVVNDFTCTDLHGSTAEISSLNTGETLVLGYVPAKLFDYPVFACLPLHGKVRWSAFEEAIDNGSLGFPIVIRTMSRLHLRERGVTYVETGVSFGKEFDIVRQG